MSASTLYQDTLKLQEGCYTFLVYDTDDDGISFWANDDGDGYVKFKKVGGSFVTLFEGDFGDGIVYNFTIDYPLTYDELYHPKDINVYPNPASELLNVHLNGFSKELQIELLNNMGQTIYKEEIESFEGHYSGIIHLTEYPTGIYMLVIRENDQTHIRKIIKE